MSNSQIFTGAKKRRIGRKVFHVNDIVYRQCRQFGVTDKDIIDEYNKFRRVGIETTWGVAAQSAVREKCNRGLGGGFKV